MRRLLLTLLLMGFVTACTGNAATPTATIAIAIPATATAAATATGTAIPTVTLPSSQTPTQTPTTTTEPTSAATATTEPTSTTEPTEVIPPTATTAPTPTPEPSATPAPATLEPPTPTQIPVSPTSSNTPLPPTETPIPPTATPEPPTVTPTAPTGFFSLVTRRLLNINENAGCIGNHNAFVKVIDAFGNPLNGVTVYQHYEGGEVVLQTGYKPEFPGGAVFDLYGGYNIGVRADADGSPAVAAEAFVTSHYPTNPELISAGYCADEDDCNARAATNQLCFGHYSYEVVYQRGY